MQTNKPIIASTDLKKYWRTLSNNWFLVTAFIIGSYASYLIYFHYQTNYIAARTQIALKYNPNNKKEYTDYSDEMIGIKSYDLIERTIDSLHMGVSYFTDKESVLKEEFDHFPFTVFVKVKNPDLYEKPISIKLINENDFDLTYLKDGNKITEHLVFDMMFPNNDFQIEAVKNDTINAVSIGYFKQENYVVKIHNLDDLIKKCQAALQIEMTKDLAVLQVTFQDELPQRAVKFLDALSQRFLNNTVIAQVELNRKTLVGLEKQLANISGILNEVRGKLVKYQEGNVDLDLDQSKQIFIEKVKLGKLEKEKLDKYFAMLTELEKYIIADKNDDGLPPNFYNNCEDQFLKNNMMELYNSQLAKKSGLYTATDQSVDVQSKDFKINLLKKNLLTYINNNKIDTKAKITDFQGTTITYEGHKADFYQKQSELNDLQRQFTINERMYLGLLEKKNLAIIAQSGIAPEYKILERAHIYSINKAFNYLLMLQFLGVGISIALGICYLFLLYHQRIETFEELKALTNLPIIGEIPFLNMRKEKIEVMFMAHHQNLVARSFHNIRTNLRYLSSSGKGKVIMVTSHNPGEGKTFTTVNLASILAKSNKRVLILDLDLHKPSVQKAMGLLSSDKVSINTLLKDSNSFIEDCIKKTELLNIDVILAWPAGKQASELIANHKIKDIIDFGCKNYDYILIDTAPLGIISDALNLMDYSDITLFVINAKSNSSQAIRHAHEIISQHEKLKISFILNGVKSNRLRYSSSYDYYGANDNKAASS